jgi:hypothetical protein
MKIKTLHKNNEENVDKNSNPSKPSDKPSSPKDNLSKLSKV